MAFQPDRQKPLGSKCGLLHCCTHFYAASSTFVYCVPSRKQQKRIEDEDTDDNSNDEDNNANDKNDDDAARRP